MCFKYVFLCYIIKIIVSIDCDLMEVELICQIVRVEKEKTKRNSIFKCISRYRKQGV